MNVVHIPQDGELELRCLGAIFSSTNAANEAFVSLSDEDFFNPKNKKIFHALKEVYSFDKSCSLESVCAHLSEKKENINKRELFSISILGWSGMSYSEYYERLNKFTQLRRAYYAGKELIDRVVQQGANYDEIIAHHQNQILLSMGACNDVITAYEIYNDYRKEMSYIDYAMWRRERFLQGLPTYEGVLSGFPLLDNTLGSFQNGGLYYVGARTSMGKTTFILNLISKMLNKYRIGVFSLEMDAQMIFEKLICIHADIKYSKFSRGDFTLEQMERIKSLEPTLSKDCLFIEDEQALSLAKLCARAKRMKINHNIDILFIDYLTLIKADTKYPSKHMQVDEVSKGLQSLAKALKIPVVCLAQLNRAAAGKDGERPTLAHFRESGSIEEDADACLLIHRPEYYNQNDKPGSIEVNIAKNRIMGTLKTIQFSCNSMVSERYHELEDIKKMMDDRREKEFAADFDEKFR